MTITVLPNADVKQKNLHEPVQSWQATGDDPAFFLHFSIWREPSIVVEISAETDQNLDPKIYVNRGLGFREADAVSCWEGRRFIITADIGRIGNVCSMRIDPCSFPADFSFDVRTFPSTADAHAYISSRVTDQFWRVEDLGEVPRFWLRLTRPRFRKKNILKQYAEASYRLAQVINLPPYSGDLPWLSIIVPVYNAPKRYLDDLVRSFETQAQGEGVELILSDDASSSQETKEWLASRCSSQRIKLVRRSSNGGISAATNEGLAHATGEWIAFLDHDDLIAPHALKMLRKTLSEHSDAIFLYTDELVVDDRLKLKGAMLKPAYDPVLLTGVNYINHFSLYRRARLEEIGYLRSEFDGSQDYDLLLRYLEGQASEQILHLPYPAYWWRRAGDTYSRTFIEKATENARKAIRERLARDGKRAEVQPAISPTLHRPAYDHPAGGWPLISIIIPSKDNPSLILQILRDIFEKTDYPNYEVIIVDNGSTDSRTLDIYQNYSTQHANFKVAINPEDFNFSRSINRGKQLACGQHFLVLNNDVEVIEPGWLKEMVSCLTIEGTGIVGAKLLFPNGNIQHAGVIVGFGGLAGHLYLNSPRDFGGEMNRLHVRNSITCVTGAVMLISGDCWRSVGAWDEEHFAVAYNDVDYCLRASKAGYRIVWTPFACLVHHESLSRGAEAGKEKKKRFEREKAHLRALHHTMDYIDPALNPNYSRDRSIPSIMVPQALHAARTWGAGDKRSNPDSMN